MSVGKNVALNSFLRDFFQFGIYKRTQGRLTRQLTCLAVWVVAALCAWRVYEMVLDPNWRYALSLGILLVGLFGGFRLVNYSKFADFLIAVEAEMNKVSWPSGPELVRSSIVVIFVIFALAAVLYGMDLVWTFLFQLIGVG